MGTSSQLRVMHIISGDLWAGAEVQAFTLLKYLQPSVSLHVVLMNEGELANRLRAINIQISVLSESQLSTFAIFKSLVRLIKRTKPHIIHTHRQKENIVGGLANVVAFPFSGASSLRTTHGAPESRPSGKQKIQVWLDAWVGRNLQSAVIAVSDDLAKKLHHIFPVSHIKVVQNGVDCDGLAEQKALADFKIAEPNHVHVGIVGRLEPVKRVDIFIDMATHCITSNLIGRPCTFHVIGDGSLRSTLEARVKANGMQGSIIFHGHRSDMAACIASLDAIVMCSDHEGTPMTVLEALYLGTPVIAHDVGGLHELLHDYAELLVQDHEPVAYAKSLAAYVNGNYPPPVLPAVYRADSNAASILDIYKRLASLLPS